MRISEKAVSSIQTLNIYPSTSSFCVWYIYLLFHPRILSLKGLTRFVLLLPILSQDTEQLGETAKMFDIALLWKAPVVNPVNHKARSIPGLNPINMYGRVFTFAWFGFFVAFWSWV